MDMSTLRDSQDRQLHREGIPMYLALVDETDRAVPACESATRADGGGVAHRLRAAHGSLAGRQRDDDLGVAGGIMQAVAHADFDAASTAAPGTP